MNKLKLISVSEIKTEKTRTDGKKSRDYFTIEVKDSEDVFGESRTKNIFQFHTDIAGSVTSWKGISYTEVKTFVGREIPGQIVTSKVAPYAVEGTSNVATKYTAVVLKSESVDQVFASAGHTLALNEVQNIEQSKSNSGLALQA